MLSFLSCVGVVVLVSHVTGQLSCNATIPCVPGTSCHPTLEQCVPDAPALDRPSFFLGCDRASSDCDYFGFDYDNSYHRGDKDWCDGPDNVRCVSQVAPPAPTPSSSHELHLATYNVWERPFWITMDGQRERTCRIPRELAVKWPQLDVITFQETFMGGCVTSQASLRDLMTQHGFPYHTRNVAGINVLNGGIWLASRWPIVDSSQFVFRNVHPYMWDFFASKGVTYAKIEKTVDGETRVYHVMGTHMQAGGGGLGDVVRQAQVAEWADWVPTLNIPAHEPVLYSGDFNIHNVKDATILVNVTSVLKAVVPPLLEDEPPVPKHSAPPSLRTQIDYAMYSSVHLQPSYGVQRFLNPVDEPFPICWCEVCPWPRGYNYPDAECNNVVMREKLSDHRPIYGKFIF